MKHLCAIAVVVAMMGSVHAETPSLPPEVFSPQSMVGPNAIPDSHLSWLLLIYFRGTAFSPTIVGDMYDSRYECMLAKYKHPIKHKAICVTQDTEIPYLSDH